MNSYNLLETKIGAAQRLVETVLNLPEFAARLDGNLDVGGTLRNGEIILLDGADADPESRTALYRSWNLSIFRYLQAHFATTRKPCPVLIVWDEAPATNCIGPMEINMLREARKFGLAGWIAGQDLSFIDLETKRAVKAITPDHAWYNPGDDELAVEAARDIGLALLDPYLIHHTTTQQRHAGFIEQERITRTRTEFGDDSKTSISTGTHLVPQYDDFEKIEYFRLQDQLLLPAQKLVTMRPGFRMIRTPDFVTPNPVYSPMLPDPYPEAYFPGLAEKKTGSGDRRVPSPSGIHDSYPLGADMGTNNNAIARTRDQRALDFLENQPASAEQLVKAGIYQTVQKARERLARAERKGLIKLIGYVQNERGRDVKLYARFPVNKPQHEYEVTELILGARYDKVRRGLTVDERNADAELVIGGKLHYLEHDRGTMGYAEVIGRLDKYLGCTSEVLWVMSSRTRIDGLLHRTKGLPGNFWFTTYEQARLNFHGEIWENSAKERAKV